MEFGTVAQHIVNGLNSGTIYALVAVGITLVFGLTGMVNFAHGELMMIGAYVVYYVAKDGGAKFLLGLVAAIAVVGLLSMASDRLLFRQTFGRPINGFIVSLGLIIIFQNAIIGLEGTSPRFVGTMVSGVVEIGDVRVSIQRLFAVVLALALLVGMYWVIQRTRFGLALQATAMDREIAGLMGINILRTITLTFLLGGLLAGAAGALVSALAPITPLLGHSYITKGFAVALLGGLGSVKGALAASLLVGMTESLVSALGWSEWVGVSTFALMIAVLLVRPQGLFRGVEGSSVA